MGWEVRAGKRVYYRKVRFKDEAGRSRVRSIYFGSGEDAETAAREDEERRDQAKLVTSGVECATPAVTDIRAIKKGGGGNAPHKKKTAGGMLHVATHLACEGEVDTFDTSTRAGELVAHDDVLDELGREKETEPARTRANALQQESPITPEEIAARVCLMFRPGFVRMGVEKRVKLLLSLGFNEMACMCAGIKANELERRGFAGGRPD